MAYTVLARRYRSKTFDDVVGQEHIAQTLKKAIESGRIAHAFLFCGTRGTGKTSMARILAKALNCASGQGPVTVPCGKCDSCLSIARGEDLDVFEIDAASHTGVDNVREIIENSQYRPARSRYKIYIIDEVHMLSKSAFNALLKTLEEPPDHVKFILATTEAEKVLPTIQSRCQRYDFRNIPTRQIAAHLKGICQSEKIEADEDALALVAKAGAGSMRDALSLLDRLLSIGETRLSVQTIEQLLGLPRSQLLFELAEAIGQADVAATLRQTDTMLGTGLSVDAVIASLVDHLRNLLVVLACGIDSGLVEVPGVNPADLAAQAKRYDAVTLSQGIAILEELRRNIRQSQTGRALLDATLVRLALAKQFESIGDVIDGLDHSQAGGASETQKKKPEPVNVTVVSPPAVPKPPPSPGIPPGEDAADDDDDLPRPGKVWDSGPSESLASIMAKKNSAATAETPTPPAPVAPLTDPQQVWSRLLEEISKQEASMAGVLKSARMNEFRDGQAVIIFPASVETFGRTWQANGKRERLANLLTQITGQPTGALFEFEQQAQPSPESPPATASAPVAAIAAPPPRVEPTETIATIKANDPRVQAALADPNVQKILNEFGGTPVTLDGVRII